MPSPAARTAPADRRDRLFAALKTHWGYDTLRPLQEEAIDAALDGRDSLVVLPTGGGKSLCYQLPPLLRGGTDLVISPLISLLNPSPRRRTSVRPGTSARSRG